MQSDIRQGMIWGVIIFVFWVCYPLFKKSFSKLQCQIFFSDSPKMFFLFALQNCILIFFVLFVSSLRTQKHHLFFDFLWFRFCFCSVFKKTLTNYMLFLAHICFKSSNISHNFMYSGDKNY